MEAPPLAVKASDHVRLRHRPPVVALVVPPRCCVGGCMGLPLGVSKYPRTGATKRRSRKRFRLPPPPPLLMSNVDVGTPKYVSK
jgi:hypothetical protein